MVSDVNLHPYIVEGTVEAKLDAHPVGLLRNPGGSCDWSTLYD